MSERDLRTLVAEMDPSEAYDEDQPTEAEREAEMRGWFAAVNIKDYVQMFRVGCVLATTIYGDPYPVNVEAMEDSTLSDQLAEKVSELQDSGLVCVEVPKPVLDEIFPKVQGNRGGDIFDNDIHEQNSLKELFGIAFSKQMYSGGFRDVAQVGAQGYLDKVPDSLELFSYCAPDATKTFVTTEGYVATGYDLQPDFERPLSQRGGNLNDFLRKCHQQAFSEIIEELEFIKDHQERFEFDDTDLLGYRPLDLSESGVTVAWDGLKG